MIKHRISYKLIACYIVMAVGVFILLNSYGKLYLKDQLIQKEKNRLYTQTEMIMEDYAKMYYSSNMTYLQLIRNLNSISRLTDRRIWLINNEGRVMLDTQTKENGNNVLAWQPDLFDKTFVCNSTLGGMLSQKVLGCIMGIPYDYTIRGFIFNSISMDKIDLEVAYILNFMHLCYLIFLFFLAFIFAFIYYITVYQIGKLKKLATEYARGNFEFQASIHTKDEYKDLKDAISYMADELKSLDDYQKKFVANISHDFRSPLTSIRGYAKAIQDGTIPYEMQNKYLDIILFETDRLTKLTTNLLELNSFDQKGTMLDIRSFDVNEVIRKTAATFEGYCEKKKIVLKLQFSDTQEFVDADRDKIQQVFYNLIDNAIKFSNNNSTIHISTELKGSKVIVSIKDHGIGIPKDSIKKIWERFYKTDTSRGKDKKGTGLGLSITKEIILAHKEEINVISTEGVGTEFIFTLPRSD